MLRPLAFLDQNNTETYLRMAEFGLGDNLLVCPITTPGAEGRWMYLPRGDWFYYWTDMPRPAAAKCGPPPTSRVFHSSFGPAPSCPCSP